MKTTYISYKYDTSSISEGQVFPTFKALFKAVTHREPPTGKASYDAAKDNLHRYLDWDLCCNRNPHEKSKRAVIVLAIHHPPLPPLKDGRGKMGIYIGDLKSLLMQVIYQEGSYDGKPSELFNQLGLFSKYFDEMKRTEKVQRALERNGNPFDYNLWGNDQHLGKDTYNRIMRQKLKEIVTTALNSLQKEGIIEWHEHYIVIPNLYNEQYELKNFLQFKEEYKECKRNLGQAAARKNSVLNAELVATLLFKPIDYKRVKENNLLNYRDNATKRQTQAIENYQQFLMQCSIKEYHHQEELPKKSNLPEQWRFFRNPKLNKLYSRFQKEYAPTLLGGTLFWKQIHIVIADKNKLKQYFNYEKNSQIDKTASDMVSLKVLDYMERQLKKQTITPDEDDIDDIRTGFGLSRIEREYSLKYSKSAMDLHTHLKELYNETTSDEEFNYSKGE